jgi:hypothetical protein
MFSKYEPLQSILLGEALEETGAVLPRAAGDVVRHADLQYAVRPVGHDIYPSGHLKIFSVGPAFVEGRMKSGRKRK